MALSELSKKMLWLTLVVTMFMAPDLRAESEGEDFVVDFGEGEVSEAGEAAEPTAIPQPQPETVLEKEASVESVPATIPDLPTKSIEPQPEAVPAKDVSLDEVSFEEEPSAAGSIADSEDGLVIIAPGSSSPEDSLASFGIESPFDVRRKRDMLKSPMLDGREIESGTGEAIELSAPERSDLVEKIAVEDAFGESFISGDDLYTDVERAGSIVSEGEMKFDGEIYREKHNSKITVMGSTIYLKIVEGRQVYLGSEYTVFHENGLVQPDSSDAPVGMLLSVAGTLKVIRVDSDYVMARVTRTYSPIQPGDKVRLRDPEKQRYLTSLRSDKGRLRLDLNGKVIVIKDRKGMAAKDDIIYLDFGRVDGAAPGQRFLVYRDQPEFESLSAGNLSTNTLGRVGLVEVLSTRLKSATARVVSMGTPLLVGDRVRYR